MQRLTLYGESRSGNCYKAAWMIPLQPFPEVTAWIARIESLPGFQSMLQACRSFP